MSPFRRPTPLPAWPATRYFLRTWADGPAGDDAKRTRTTCWSALTDSRAQRSAWKKAPDTLQAALDRTIELFRRGREERSGCVGDQRFELGRLRRADSSVALQDLDVGPAHADRNGLAEDGPAAAVSRLPGSTVMAFTLDSS
jgi:hypothetical protein